jgi:hypothetical protein
MTWRRYLGASSAVATQRNREHNRRKMMRKITGISVVLPLLFTGLLFLVGDSYALSGSVISAGGRHSLFLKTDGTVWAAGYNDYGRLNGVGDASIIEYSQPPEA